MKEEIVAGSKKLEGIRLQLKQEFIGLDQIIDKVMVPVRGWYLFNHFKQKPTIINLWGMTGVGKTSLVSRLVELLEYEEHYYRFDLGELTGSRVTIYDQLVEQNKRHSDKPLILCLDEFQRAKSKKEDGSEIRDPNLQIVWQLLDDGKIKSFDRTTSIYGMRHLNEFINKCRYLRFQGIKVKDGIVTHKKELFKKIIKEEGEASELFFVHPQRYSDILATARGQFQTDLQVAEKLMVMNETETINFLESLQQQYINPAPIDCSNALIFNLGNLDDLYPFSANYSKTVTPDVFHQESKKIDKYRLRSSLKNLFRHEQLARLGNHHILYPALSEDAFLQKIDHAIDQLGRQLKKEYSIELEVSDKVKQLLFEEGVIPTLGFRPLEGTIQERISNNVLLMLETEYALGLQSDTFTIDFNGEHWTGQFLKKGKPIRVTHLSERIKAKEDYTEKHALIAVHESGHLICNLYLRGLIPDFITIKGEDGFANGLIHYPSEKDEMLIQKDILNILAGHLGGKAAEEIVFGSNHISLGSASDLDQATCFASRAFRKNGQFGSNALFDNINRYEYGVKDERINTKVEMLLDQAYELAKNTLHKHKSNLLDFAWELLHAKKMNQLEVAHTLKKLEIHHFKYKSQYSFKKSFLNARRQSS